MRAPSKIAFVLAAALAGLVRTGSAGDPADATRSLEGVSASQAERLRAALLHSSSSRKKESGVEVKVGWKESCLVTSPSGWSVHGTLASHYAVAEEKHNPVFGWWRRTKKIEFDSEKEVRVSYDSKTRTLTATIVDGAETAGTYDVTAKSRDAHADLSALEVSSKNFSVAAAADGKEVKADVKGLPYVLSPHIVLGRVGEGHLRLELGMLWQSQVNLSAAPVAGSTREASFDLAFAHRDVVRREAGHASRAFQSTVAVKADGEGILGALSYDETETKDAYSFRLRACQDWSVQVENFPLAIIQTAHWEKREAKKLDDGARLPNVEDDGLAAPQPRAPEQRAPADLGSASADRVKQLYAAPSSDPESEGFLRRLDVGSVSSASCAK